MLTECYELARMTAHELVAAYAAGTLSPVEVHDAVQAVIDEREPVLNAFWVRDRAASQAQAKQSEQRWRCGEPRGPVDGVPVTLKENIARRGVPMPSGCAAVSPIVPERDAPITERIAESGGVVLGSTVMPDWGMLSSGVSSLHGITRSPWNPEWTTGGSSAGAGAAAAAGYGPLHVGSDIGGSIRLPGSWLGLATLKPSFGRVPLDAPYLGRCAGPMARSVADLALFMRVLAQPDSRDWMSLPPATIDWRGLSLAVDKLRVGVQWEAGCGMPVDPQVAAAVRRVGERFGEAGAAVEEKVPFMTEDLLQDLDLFLRVRSWNDYHALPAGRREKVLPFIAQWCHGGADVSGTRVLRSYQSIMQLSAAAAASTEPFDVVLSPAAPVAAFPAEWPMPFGFEDQGMAHIAFTAPFNMSGQPSATVNCGFTDDGRPIGVQISGHRFADLEVLRAAHWYEQHRPDSAVPAWPIVPPAGQLPDGPVTGGPDVAGGRSW